MVFTLNIRTPIIFILNFEHIHFTQLAHDGVAMSYRCQYSNKCCIDFSMTL